MRNVVRGAVAVAAFMIFASQAYSRENTQQGSSGAKVLQVKLQKGKKPPGKRRPPPHPPGASDANRDVGKKPDSSATSDDPGAIEHQPDDPGPETKASPLAWSRERLLSYINSLPAFTRPRLL